jgi:hypothetical protein
MRFFRSQGYKRISESGGLTSISSNDLKLIESIIDPSETSISDSIARGIQYLNERSSSGTGRFLNDLQSSGTSEPRVLFLNDLQSSGTSEPKVLSICIHRSEDSLYILTQNKRLLSCKIELHIINM